MTTTSMAEIYSDSSTDAVIAPVPLFARPTGFWLLLVLPLVSALVYFLYTRSVDLEWLYVQRGSPLDEASNLALAAQLAAKDAWWHFGKHGLWPVILLIIEIVSLGICCMGFGQLFGVDVKLRHLFLLGVWSKITYLVTAIVIIANMLFQDLPFRLLTTNLDPLSWNSLLGLKGDRPIQFLTCNQGPLSLLGIAIIASGFRALTNRGWLQSIAFGILPYGLYLASQYYLFGVVFK